MNETYADELTEQMNKALSQLKKDGTSEAQVKKTKKNYLLEIARAKEREVGECNWISSFQRILKKEGCEETEKKLRASFWFIKQSGRRTIIPPYEEFISQRRFLMAQKIKAYFEAL